MTDKHNSVDAKVLHTALARMTTDRIIIKQAFNYWLDNFSNEPLDVINTVAALEKYLGLSTQERKTLMISLHASAGRSEQELAPVPDYIVANGSSVASEAKAPTTEIVKTSRPAVIELTEAYFDLILEGVRKVNAKDNVELRAVLKDEGLSNTPKELNAKLKATVDGQLDLPASTSEVDCQNLCHELYLLVADFIGPRQADSVSDRAVSALLDLSAASRYDPRKLL